MPKMRKDLNDPSVQQEIRQSEEVERWRQEVIAGLDVEKERRRQAGLPDELDEEQEEESRGR